MKRAALLLPVAAALICLADDGNAPLLPDGPGKDAVAKVCTECHSVDRMRGLRLDKDAWDDKMSDMVDQGAKATDADRAAVVSYLSTNFGPGAKVWVNTAPLVELKTVLGFSVTQAEAVIAYRKTNGNFTQSSDLLKVPGLDPQKVEAAKDQMQF